VLLHNEPDASQSSQQRVSDTVFGLFWLFVFGLLLPVYAALLCALWRVAIEQWVWLVDTVIK
jgi:hypothetical protein